MPEGIAETAAIPICAALSAGYLVLTAGISWQLVVLVGQSQQLVMVFSREILPKVGSNADCFNGLGGLGALYQQ